ncbi:MAG: TlpA family protein disulfide reductase [Lachnospiraceae bacterium]|nr:TlpA family protein disulfide reductase [Lachnospiraceae bacterium]
MKKKLTAILVLTGALVLGACANPFESVQRDNTSVSSEISEKEKEDDHVVLNLPEKKEDETSVSEEPKPEDPTPATSDEPEEYYYGDYTELSEGDRAPWFAADLVDGGKFEMADLKGKVVLVNFWATWCGPCVREMPAFEWLYAEYSTDDVAIVAVNCMDAKSDVDSFVSENGYTFPVAYDVDGSIEDQYPTDGIPYTVVVGKDGYIKNIYIGAYDAQSQYEEYKSAIDAALSE